MVPIALQNSPVYRDYYALIASLFWLWLGGHDGSLGGSIINYIMVELIDSSLIDNHMPI